MRKFSKPIVPLLLLIWAVAFITSVQAQFSVAKQGTDPIPFHEEVRKGKLANGMEYYLLKNKKPEKRAELRLALKAGSILEDNDQQGGAHFDEHMCFNGSTNFKKNDLVDYLEKVGTKFGPDLNAYTSFDETVYMLQIRTDDQEQFDKGILVLHDWAGGVSFDDTEIDKERGVVESEWRTRLSPDQRMQNKYFPVMYAGSQYGKRLPIGEMDIIRNAPHDNFKRFYRDWYRPNLMALVIVGDIDLDAVEKKIKNDFSSLKNPVNERPRKEFDVPKHKNTLVSICSDKEATSTTVQLMYKHDYQKPKNLSDLRREMIYSLYNQMINSRLEELSRSPEPPFNFAYTYYGQNVGSLSTYSSYAQTKDGGAKNALKTLLEENERVKRYGFNASELERMKTQMLKNTETAFKEKDKTDSRGLVMGIVYNFLQGSTFMSPGQDLELTKNILPTISIEDINALAKFFITDENRVVVVTSPEKPDVKLPTEDELLNLLNTIKDMRIDAYVDKVSNEPLMAKLPVKGSIISESSNSKLGTITWKLSNGATVILKPTTFKNDEILFAATSEGGSSQYGEKDDMNSSNATSLVTSSGIGTYDQTSLDKYLTGKELYVQPYISSYREGMNGSTTTEDMETFFQLANMYFTAPRKDVEAFSSFKAKRIAFLKNFLSDPQRYFMVETMKIKTQDNPRARFSTVADIEGLNQDRMLEIYKDRFGDASGFTFFLTGSFKPETLKPLIELYIASLPSKNKVENAKDLGIRFPSEKVEKGWDRGTAPKSNVDITFHTPFEWTDRNRYVFQAMLEVLRIKLRESLREDKGGVYGVSVSGGPKKFPLKECSITVSFNCTPGNEKNLIDAAMEVIKNTKSIGADEKDLTKVKELQKQERIKNLEDNQFWNRGLLNCYENDINAELLLLENYEKFISSLTAEDIKSASNTYIDEKTMISIVGKPENQVVKP